MAFVNDWTQTRSEIISMALRICGVLPTGDDTSSDFITNQTAEASAAFNMILASLQNETSSPFKTQELSVPLVASGEITGSDSLIYTCISTHITPNTTTWASSTSYSKGALVFPTTRAGYYYQAQNAGTSGGSEPTWIASNAQSITDNTITWLSYPDTKPITGASYKQYWKQEGSTGGTYTQNKEYRSINQVKLAKGVIELIKVWYRDSSSNDTMLTPLTRQEYEELSDKSSTGDPTHCFFNDGFTPTLYLYPTPSDTSKLIMYEALMSVNDMDSGSDTGLTTENFKNRWIQYMVYALAEHLGEEYQLSDTKIARIGAKAREYKRLAIARDINDFSSEFLSGSY